MSYGAKVTCLAISGYFHYYEGYDLTSAEGSLDSKQIEEFTQKFLGRFLIAFARMELNLTLQVGAAGNFQEKLERYYNMAMAAYGDRDEHF